MRRILALFIFVLFFGFVRPVQASLGGYEVRRFEADISLTKDTSFLITERIDVNFLESRHGIYREIPSIYRIDGRRINSKLSVQSVTNELGVKIPYKVSKSGDYVSIKIGDSQKTVLGEVSYVITYRIKNILVEYDEHYELYWNVVGSGWDAPVENVTANVISEYAGIVDTRCYSGKSGSSKECTSRIVNAQLASFLTEQTLGNGRDMSIVVAFDKNNELVFPGFIERFTEKFINIFGYLAAPLGLVYILFFWFKHGRDKRYLSDSVYYEPDDKSTKTVSIFKRAHLPTFYHPLDNVTPGELGTIIDERVDIRDVVAEIAELARLRFLKMEIVTKKKFLGKSTDYKFIRLEKDTKPLRDYQKYLYEKLFESGDEVLLSSLENKFYKHLPEFKKRIYEQVVKAGYFPTNPERVRIKWFFKLVVLEVFLAFIIYWFYSLTGNYLPFIVFGIFSVISFPITFLMPRKTAAGYAVHRQGKGLAFYVNKGKWRHEINEKRLFFEDMLPLAISLGVTKKLASEMKKLGVSPPSYVGGTNAIVLANIGSMDSAFGKSISSSPKSSGGSGFGGGSAGGGFGGGGGGSW